MPKQQSMINEDRLFKKIGDFFSNPSAVLIEIAQNAARAGATNLNITIDEANNILSAGDNGKGIDDPAPLFVLADSAWSNEIEEIQNPAGWGNYFLIALSEKVTYRSNFGSISFDCSRFLDKSDYRNQVLSAVDNFQSCNGFYLEAKLKPGLAGKILAEKKIVSFFDLAITVNGEPVKKKYLSKTIKNSDIVTEYKGNKVGIQLSYHLAKHEPVVKGVWYGIPIPEDLIENDYIYDGRVLIDIKNGSPLTPVLPYRYSFKEDRKMQEFQEFIRKAIVDYCIGFLNNRNNTSADDASEASDIILGIGTQEEIDRLERICINKKEPYSKSSFLGWDDWVFVSKGETIVSEELKFSRGNEEFSAGELDDVFLPEGTVTIYKIPEKKPYWFNVTNKIITINVPSESKSGGYKGFYTWKKSKITCKEKQVKVVGVICGYSEGTVYYSSAPEDFDEISERVFLDKYFNDENGQSDNQEYDFNEEINKDIRNITKHYDLSHLLANFYDVKEIQPGKITAIKINRKKGLMEICLGKKKKLLKVA